MKRLALVLAIGALLLGACSSGGDEVAATVNGTEITVGDVEGLLFEVSDFDREPEAFATYLGVTIQWEAIDQRVNGELGFVPSEAAIDAKVREVVINAGFLDIPTYLQQQNLSEPALRRLASQLVIEEHLHEMLTPEAEQPSDEEVQQELDDNPTPWVTEVCASHILLLTVEEADEALARLGAGEDFAKLATELSIDTASAQDGGSLGCADPGGYVNEFAVAASAGPIGEVVGPVETQFGAHLILVESRDLAPFEDVRAALADRVVFELVSEWLSETVKAAEVTVDESHGTWVTDPVPLVQPPAQLS